MARFLRNRFYLLAFVFGLTVGAGRVLAQASPSVAPVNISPVSAGPSGLQTMATYQASGAGAANGYYSRPVLVSNNTLGGLANGLIRRAAPVAAMVAAVTAAGWVIDELTKQVMTPGSGETPSPGQGVYCYTAVSRPLCAPHYSAFVGNNVPWQGGTYTITAAYPNYVQVNNGQVGGMTVTYTAFDPVAHDVVGVTAPQPVPLPDLGAVIRENPNLWNDALRNPDGSVNRNPDVMAEADRLRDALTNPDPVSNPTPNPGAEWDTGLQGGEPQPGANAQPFELPAFCSWASVVCSALEWFQDDEDAGEDTPPDFIEPSLDVSWNSGFGGGSCPAPVQFEVMGGDVVIPFDFLCDVAVYIRPVVLAAAALMALMIVGGYRRAS